MPASTNPASPTRKFNVTADLVIEPGTVVLFGQNVVMRIESSGSITAVGNEENRIVLAGERPLKGYWYGLCFSDNRESLLDHVDVLFGGGALPHGPQPHCAGAVAGAASAHPT